MTWTDVVMPQMGESIAEGTITKWLVEVGQIVGRDQPLFEISTDKVDAEIPSPAAGIVRRIHYLEGTTVPVATIVAAIESHVVAEEEHAEVPTSPMTHGEVPFDPDIAFSVGKTTYPRVFLVHGHEEIALEKTARFLERLGLETIVLNEQPNRGATLIEKFVLHSQVDFAVVLLTADDRGGPKLLEFDQQKLRARQNVIFELGYFIGALGRGRVCALYEDGVEFPSDFTGIAYIPWDRAGAWKLELAQELQAAGFALDLRRLLR